jgi:outer membrane protein TolC
MSSAPKISSARAVTAFSLAALATLAGTSPVSARTLDRQAAIRAALAQNPQIAAARAEEAAMKALGRQADALRWPIVSTTAGVAPGLKATLVPGTSVTSVEKQYSNWDIADLTTVFLANITIVQPLYTFGKIAIRQEAAAHGLRAREAQTRMQRADVAFEVARIYESYLMAREAFRFFGETVHWLESTLEGTQDRLSKNVKGVTDRDVLRLQAAIGPAEMGVHQGEAGMAQAMAGLQAYLALPMSETIAFPDDEQVPVGTLPRDLGAAMKLATEKRPEVTALREGQIALDAMKRAEKAGFLPDVFALAFLDAAYAPRRDWIETRYVTDPLNHFIPGFMLGLRWLFQGDMAQARAQEQGARSDVLRHMGEWAAWGIPAQVRAAYEDVVRARKSLEGGRGAVRSAKQWMVQASADYSVGLLDIRELADAVTSYTTLRTALMKARYEHNVAMAALSKATGTLEDGSNLFYLAPPEPADAQDAKAVGP